MSRPVPLVMSLMLSSGLCILSTSTAAMALGADELWQAWRDAGVRAGLAVTAATVARDGQSLTLTDVTVKPAVSGDRDAFVGVLDSILLTEMPDGSVTILPSAELGLIFDEDASSLVASHNGLTLTAREEAGQLIYDYAAADAAVTFDLSEELPSQDGAAPQVSRFAFSVALAAPTGTYSDAPGDGRAIGWTLQSRSVTYALKSDDRTLGMTQDQTTVMNDVAARLDLTVPATVKLMEIDSAAAFGAALDAGFVARLDMEQGVTTSVAKVEGGPFSYDLTSEGLPGKALVVIDNYGAAMVASGEGATMAISSPMLPAPEARAVLGPLGMEFRMPLTGQEAKDFRYLVKFESLTLNEEIWALVDPAATLPRDAANLVIDLAGKARLNLMQMIAAESGGLTPVPPPQIDSLDINEVSLTLAGAALAGSGAFTFDNATGTPKPLGAMDLALSGGNTLIDRLVGLGILPTDQAASARMMFAMFAVPGEGEDRLTSRIEAREDGGIYVNGQRIQ